jgi:uncharacterized MAPEG superfamily protein
VWYLADNYAIRIYAIAATVVALHLLALAGWVGTVRMARKQWVNPEDAALNKGVAVATEDEVLARVKRAHMNALENAVPFFVVGALYAASGPSKTAALIYFGTFTAARLLHSIVYLWGRQPFRTISFLVGVLAVVGMGVHVIRVSL